MIAGDPDAPLEVVDADGAVGEERMHFLHLARRQEGAVDAVGARVVDEALEHDHPIVGGGQLDAAAMLETAVIP